MPEQASLKELQQIARNIIYSDNAKLSTSNYLPYNRDQLAPMSSLTQRAQGLELRRNQKGVPYQKLLSQLSSRDPTGFTSNNVNDISNILQNTQQNLNTNLNSRLITQFGNAYTPRQFNPNQQLKIDEFKYDLNQLNPKIKDLQLKRDKTAFETIANSSQNKLNREKNLIKDLKEYGDQKHNIVNQQLAADQANFEDQRNEPYTKLKNLNAALAALDLPENMQKESPELSKVQAQQLLHALQAYGIDTSKPMSQWQTARVNTPSVYKGQLVAPTNSELTRSYELAENLSPSYTDANYVDRKLTRKSIADNNVINNVINNVVNELPNQLQPKFATLDAEAKKKIEADLNALNAKYIKTGGYGSNAHLQAVNNRMRDLTEAALSARSDLVKDDLVKTIADKEQEHMNQLSKMSGYDLVANNEFGNILGDIRRINSKGMQTWNNANQANANSFNEFVKQKANMNPKILQQIRGINNVGGYEELSKFYNDLTSNNNALKTKYNNDKKEAMSNKNKIRSLEEYNAMSDLLAKQNATEYSREQEQQKQLADETDILNKQAFLNDVQKRLQTENNPEKRKQLQDLIQPAEIKREELRQAAIAREEAEKQRQEELRQAAIAREEAIAREKAEKQRQEELRQAAEKQRQEELRQERLLQEDYSNYSKAREKHRQEREEKMFKVYNETYGKFAEFMRNLLYKLERRETPTHVIDPVPGISRSWDKGLLSQSVFDGYGSLVNVPGKFDWRAPRLAQKFWYNNILPKNIKQVEESLDQIGSDAVPYIERQLQYHLHIDPASFNKFISKIDDPYTKYGIYSQYLNDFLAYFPRRQHLTVQNLDGTEIFDPNNLVPAIEKIREKINKYYEQIAKASFPDYDKNKSSFQDRFGSNWYKW